MFLCTCGGSYEIKSCGSDEALSIGDVICGSFMAEIIYGFVTTGEDWRMLTYI